MATMTNTSMGAAAAASAAERSQRSVFVGNIPYEATEEELKELFSQAGPVVGFRLVFDRETGKPKGYGFCEYLDQETALSALRNLNQFEFHGRNLRVDTAAGDRSKEELRQLQMTFGGPAEESPYGPACEPAKAPEAISRAVASLPPEQMFELMKQMKLCIQNNPNEARNMLLQNPQLAYALLQAQVVMRIVDPQVAMSMLHRETNPVQAPVMMTTAPPVVGMPSTMQPPLNAFSTLPSVTGIPQSSGMMNLPVPSIAPVSRGDMDYRLLPGGISSISSSMPPFNINPSVVPSSFPGVGGGGSIMSSSYGMGSAAAASVPNPYMMPPPGSMVPPGQPSMPSLGLLRGSGPAGSAADDQERAALIMQVLQLTDDQIALLPADQKQSVLILREQLRNSQK